MSEEKKNPIEHKLIDDDLNQVTGGAGKSENDARIKALLYKQAKSKLSSSELDELNDLLSYSLIESLVNQKF